MPIRVTNRRGDSKVIKSGETRKLNHASSLKLKVRADGMEQSVRTSSHRLSVRLNSHDEICVDAC